MITFKIEDHRILPYKKVVSIMKDDKMVATITADDSGSGIRFFSSHLLEVITEPSLGKNLPVIYNFSFE